MRVVVLLIGGQPAASVDGVTGILLVAAMMEVVSGILWLANSQELRVAAIGCLLLAAGSFHVIGPLESLMARGAAASVLESLLAVAGAAVAALQPRRVYACFQGQA